MALSEAYFKAKRRKHSEKPDVFYANILKVTNAPRIDIFARKRHYGFDAWGNEVEKQQQIPLISEPIANWESHEAMNRFNATQEYLEDLKKETSVKSV